MFLTRFFLDQPIIVVKPSITKKAKKEQHNDYTYEKFFANDADSLLDKSEFQMVLVYNGWNYYTPAMEPVLCEIGSDFAAIKGSLLDALDKANKLVEELPPSSTKDSISRSMLHMRAGRDLLRRASVATGTATSTPAVHAIPVLILVQHFLILMRWTLM